MTEKRPAGKPDADPGAKPDAEADAAAKKAKKEKVSTDPAKRGYGGFDRSLFKGKHPIFRTMKKSGR